MRRGEDTDLQTAYSNIYEYSVWIGIIQGDET